MPYWSVRIDTQLSARVASERIRSLVRPRKGFWKNVEDAFDSPGSDHPFEGDVSDQSFKVRRVILYRNSFRPVIHGAIEQTPNGTAVRLRMRLPIHAAIFMMIWFGIVAISVATISLQDLRHLGSHTHVPLGMLGFGVLFVVVNFFFEAAKAVRLFRKALA